MLPLALGLGSCAASLPAYNAQQAQLRLEATSPEAYNIVWLRATLRNNSQWSFWLPSSNDSIYEPQPRSPMHLQGATPKGAALKQCDPRLYKLSHLHYTKLLPGTERTVFIKVDFNQVFPISFLDSLSVHDPHGDLACGEYLNRTLGAYQFFVRAVGTVRRPPNHHGYGRQLRRNQYWLEAQSNTVTVTRKK